MAIQKLTGHTAREAFGLEARREKLGWDAGKIALVVGIILAVSILIAGIVLCSTVLHRVKISDAILNDSGKVIQKARYELFPKPLSFIAVFMCTPLGFAIIPTLIGLAIWGVGFHINKKTFERLVAQIYQEFPANDHELTAAQRRRFIELIDDPELLKAILPELEPDEQRFAIEKFGKETTLRVLLEYAFEHGGVIQKIEDLNWTGEWAQLHAGIQTIQNGELASPFAQLYFASKIEALSLNKRLLVAHHFYMRTIQPNDADDHLEADPALPGFEYHDFDVPLASHSHFLQPRIQIRNSEKLILDLNGEMEPGGKVEFALARLFSDAPHFPRHLPIIRKLAQMLTENRPVEFHRDEERLVPHVLAVYFDDFFEGAAKDFLTPLEMERGEHVT
jgi:hypothetical protein